VGTGVLCKTMGPLAMSVGRSQSFLPLVVHVLQKLLLDGSADIRLFMELIDMELLDHEKL